MASVFVSPVAPWTAEGVAKALRALEPIEWEDFHEPIPAKATPARNAESLRAMLGGPRPAIRRLGEVLVDSGTVSRKQLETALAMQQRGPRKLLGEVLVEQGALGTSDLRAILASRLGIPAVDLSAFPVKEAAAKLVPHSLCMRHKVVPLMMHGDALVVAMENPLSAAALEAITFASGKRVIPAQALQAVIETPMPSHVEPALPVLDEASVPMPVGVDELTARLGAELPHQIEDYVEEVRESDSTLVRLVNKIIADAHESGASDIHIEPLPGKRPTRIRMRRDGVLQEYAEVPARFRSALVSRLKIMANLNIAERRKPQDGSIDFSQFAPVKLELRIATIPTHHGMENVILRLLTTVAPRALDEIGLQAHVLARLKVLAARPHGLLLVCGPTSSGKTTTLHSLLREINTPERKIWTAEDPVEITQDGLAQVQVNPKIGFTFATALRSFLRADPDVIMVGEMRDAETAQVAVEASLTGHLVMSTLHTNSAPETVTRLLDLGADPFNFGDTLLGVLSQRLVRRVCPSCARKDVATRHQLSELAREYHDHMDISHEALIDQWLARDPKPVIAQAVGCEECDGSGYQGRVGIYEFMEGTPQLRSLIQTRAPTERIRACAVADGMRSLRQDGIERVLAGVTTMEQVRAACP